MTTVREKRLAALYTALHGSDHDGTAFADQPRTVRVDVPENADTLRELVDAKREAAPA